MKAYIHNEKSEVLFMEKKVVSLKRLLLLCVFVLMMGVIFIPQTAHADDAQTIYWSYSNNTLTLSDQPISSGSFSADTRFTVGYYEQSNYNPRPWEKYYY